MLTYAEKYLKNSLVELLSDGIVRVKFRKRNGEERDMVCTLDDTLFEYDFVGTDRRTSDEVVSVWDLEAGGWRSFRVDSIISVDPMKVDDPQNYDDLYYYMIDYRKNLPQTSPFRGVANTVIEKLEYIRKKSCDINDQEKKFEPHVYTF